MTSSEKSSEKGSEKSSEKWLQQIDLEEDTPVLQKVFFLVKNNQNISAAQIATTIGISSRAVEKHLQILKETKRIKRVGADRGGHWKILKH